MTETLSVRVFACHLLAAISQRCASKNEPVPDDYTTVLNTISDDTHPTVRATAAQTVPIAAEHPDLGRECMLSYQQRLTAMLQDKDDDVRSAAVLALAKLLEGLEAEELGSVAAPLHRVYSSSKAEQSAAMAHAFGLVFYHLREHLSTKQHSQLLSYYSSLCNCEDAEMQYWAAFNLPVRLLGPEWRKGGKERGGGGGVDVGACTNAVCANMPMAHSALCCASRRLSSSLRRRWGAKNSLCSTPLPSTLAPVCLRDTKARKG